MNIETKNAVITGTMLGIEDHGIMSCMVFLDYGGGGQAFGGYSLDTPIKDAAGKFLRREGTAYGMEFIARVLRATGAESWEKLKGTHVRVRADYGKVHAIGHIIKDQWFDPVKDLAYFHERESANA